MLKGKAKTEYQREYMRKRRASVRPLVRPEVQPETDIPLYNPSKHRAGDTVRVNGKVVRIPELDADGNAIPW